jgi:GTP cyclohydrolase IB
VILEDIQSQVDPRGIGIDHVGISGLQYPISIFDAEHGKQDTVGTVALSVSLPPEQKGSHLSRFLEVLDAHAGSITPESIPLILQEIQDRLASTDARLQVSFPYFMRRHAPVSGASALIEYLCGFVATAKGPDLSLQITARVPVTSVCPCSKAISDYGAHNQRGYITIEATPTVDDDGELTNVWFEDLIEVAERSASSPVYPLLKRPDERHVTMQGYDNPVFVEDMVRAVAVQIRDDRRIERFSVEAVNDESIHNHGAFAQLTWPPPLA